MVAQPALAHPNGIGGSSKVNGKEIKSKNQLRRLKAKQKKEAAGSEVSRSIFSDCALGALTLFYPLRKPPSRKTRMKSLM